MALSIKQIQEESKKDTIVDKNKIDKYSIELASLTSKWNNYLMDEKLFYESESMRYAILKKKKWEYYQYNHKYIIEKRGNEMSVYLDSDVDLLKIKEKMVISLEKLHLIESTIKTLNTSSFNIRNAIEFMKFQSGGY